MEFEMISGKEMECYLKEGNAFVIDLRLPAEYAARHIPGAVNIPYARLKNVKELPRDVPLILYCERGSVSMVAARELAARGYRPKTLIGGIHAWHSRLG
ncbi:MAG: rhodanese-like domain-containing protein [Hominisplanchenecus sp.]